MLTPRRGGQGGVDVALVVHKGVVDAQAVELLHQQPGHVELAVGAGVVPAGRGSRSLYTWHSASGG